MRLPRWPSDSAGHRSGGGPPMLRLNGQTGAAVQATLRHLDEQGEARRVPALLARIRRGEQAAYIRRPLASRPTPPGPGRRRGQLLLGGRPRDPGSAGGSRSLRGVARGHVRTAALLSRVLQSTMALREQAERAELVTRPVAVRLGDGGAFAVAHVLGLLRRPGRCRPAPRLLRQVLLDAGVGPAMRGARGEGGAG